MPKTKLKRLSIRETRAICESLNARAVIVMALSEDAVAGTSYGQTKKECQQAGYTLDVIVDSIAEGVIPIWATRETESARNARLLREGIEEGTYCAGCIEPVGDCDCERPYTVPEDWDQ